MIPSADSSTSRQKKIYIRAAIALIVVIVILLFLFLRHPKNIASQTPSAGNSVQSPLAQTEGNTGDTQIAPEEKTYSPPKEQPRPADQPSSRLTPQNTSNDALLFAENRIQSIALNVRFTYETKNGVALPQGVVTFAPHEDAHAYLEGPDGNVRLDVVGPVRFEKPDDRHIVIINDFFLPASSFLYWSSIENMKNFDFISIPKIATDDESSLKTMVYFDCLIEVNGRYSQAWRYYSSNMPTELGGTTIRIPITEAVKHQFDEKK